MLSFAIIAALMLASSVAAVALRNLVHCALALAVSLAALAALYLQLGAQFVGFAQVLVYVGAVAILVVFAILLTRGSEPPRERLLSSGWVLGVIVAVAAFAVIAATLLSSRALATPTNAVPSATARRLGEELMTKYVLPLEVLGALLTAALIGAGVIALREPETGRKQSQ